MNEEVKKEIERKASDLYDYCVENQIPLVLVIGKDKEFLHTAAMWTYEEMVAILVNTVESTLKNTEIDCIAFCRELANMLEARGEVI